MNIFKNKALRNVFGGGYRERRQGVGISALSPRSPKGGLRWRNASRTGGVG